MSMWTLPVNPVPRDQFLETELERTIRAMGKSVVSKGLEVPATAFLESIKPLAHLNQHFFHVFMPFLEVFFATETLECYSQVFSNPECIDQLVAILEPSRRNGHEEHSREP